MSLSSYAKSNASPSHNTLSSGYAHKVAAVSAHDGILADR